MKKIRIGVVGVGKLGQHHARILSKIENIELTAVVDILPERAKKIASLYSTSFYTDYKEIFDLVDVVTIVTPTPTHYQISKDFISHSIHCLIEKPITDNLEHAEEIINLAKEKNVTLQIGHIERFNPAVVEAGKYIHEPKYIEGRRLGPYDPRVSHIGVVLDLMIHDLDILLSLVNSKIKDLDALGTPVFSEHEDIANVRIKFADGCVADLSASRISLATFRKMRIFQPDSYISLDYQEKKIEIYRKKYPTVNSLADIEIIKPKLEKYEPLEKELNHFVECVREGKKPLVTGEHGRDALELGLEILKKIKSFHKSET